MSQSTTHDAPLEQPANGSSETSSLLPRKSFWFTLCRRYRNTHKCLRSRAALLTLFWLFVINILLKIIQPQIVGIFIGDNFTPVHIIGLRGLTLCFYPLAGFLADNVFGRFQTIRRSLHILFLALLFFAAVLVIFLVLYFFAKIEKFPPAAVYPVAIFMYVLFTVCSVVFSANVIQFGMDQLHDSPVDHQRLFIYWYVWLENLSSYIVSASNGFVTSSGELYFSNHKYKFLEICAIGVQVFLSLAAFALYLVSLCVGHVNRDWFLLDIARLNPYKLVYQVTKFACQHKVPIQRSAFTFCEDEIPSGLDLGKAKYGGPFSTEQVEDVKAFYGILKVLFALGPVFFLQVPENYMLGFYAGHIKWEGKLYQLVLRGIFFDKGIYSGILISVCIPLYVLVIRPLLPISSYGLFKRMGLGIILQLASLICTFAMDTSVHARHRHVQNCMVEDSSHWLNINSTSLLYQDSSLLAVQRSLSSLSFMLISIALYEFICSQSPQSMKGLHIGLSFAIQGIFYIMGAVVVLPFTYLRTTFPSCGMEYYAMNIGVAVVVFLVYVLTVRKYKYRIRDEPCHVYRYAEEYYSKTQQERFYDYY